MFSVRCHRQNSRVKFQDPAVAAKLAVLDAAFSAEAITSEQYYAARSRLLAGQYYTAEQHSPTVASPPVPLLAPLASPLAPVPANLRVTLEQADDTAEDNGTAPPTRPTDSRVVPEFKPPPLIAALPAREPRSSPPVRYSALNRIAVEAEGRVRGFCKPVARVPSACLSPLVLALLRRCDPSDLPSQPAWVLQRSREDKQKVPTNHHPTHVLLCAP